jgi:hypothetical protein
MTADGVFEFFRRVNVDHLIVGRANHRREIAVLARAWRSYK